MDMIIFIPNACGFLFGVIQLVLCVVFSKREDVDEHVSIEEQLVGDGGTESSNIDGADGDAEML